MAQASETVNASDERGKPAASAISRAMLETATWWITVPKTIESISLGARFERCTSSATTMRPSSSALSSL